MWPGYWPHLCYRPLPECDEQALLRPMSQRRPPSRRLSHLEVWEDAGQIHFLLRLRGSAPRRFRRVTQPASLLEPDTQAALRPIGTPAALHKRFENTRQEVGSDTD